VLSQALLVGVVFDDRAVGREVAAQNERRSGLRERLSSGRSRGSLPTFGALDILPDRFAGGPHRLCRKLFADAVEQRRQSAAS